MVWAAIIIGIIVAAVLVNEWRTRNKPMPSALQDRERGKDNSAGGSAGLGG